ncbi:AMIN-like domain-containing (lipo)protein [Corynebacterium halotolerans]|nr:hypothetical protein [Corynebacterium halotolerans]
MTEHLRISHRRRAAVTTVAVMAVGALGLAACGTGGTEGASDAGTTSAETTTTTETERETQSATVTGGSDISATSADAGVTPLGNADSSMKTLRPEAPSQLLVTDVRVGSHEGFDRIVFDLTGEGTPGWFIDYTEQPTQQGSGHPIPYQGAVALNVNLDGMTYPFQLGMEDPGIGTVPGAGNVTEVISSGTFEGRSQFVVGLSDRLPYSVQVLENPQRVVIDILQG